MHSLRLSAAVLAALAASLLAGAPASADVRFGPAARVPLPEAHLLDIGAADFDEDGNLDLFTTNHKYVSVLLHNDGNGHFDSRMGDVGLIPDPEFPGLAMMKTPPMDEPGIYLFPRSPAGKGARSYLYLRAVGMAGSGTLTFATSKVDVVRSAHASVATGKTDAGQPQISFDAREGAVVDIALRHIDLPVAASFEGVEPRDVRVGYRAAPARERSFMLTLRDRHGLAFANLGGDSAADVFAVSGGLGGGIELPGYRGEIQDELLVAHGARFVSEGAGSGLEKGACRGRESAAVDVDGDGMLDVFEGCEGAPPRIYRQVAPGSFEPYPAPRSIASTFRWGDLTGDGRPELIAGERRGIRVYSFGPDGPRLLQRVPGAAGSRGKIAQFALADFENDGDLDVLAVSRRGNSMLLNREGRLHRVSLGRLGLPNGSVAASFVDVDDDGRLDLHLVPQGLFERTGRRSFLRTGEAATPEVGAAVTTWFDADNDGLRDPVIATGPSPFSNEKRISRARNLGPGGHWLELDLAGPPGNEQAVGARAQVRCGSHRWFGFVGQSDDSRYSQGHYRLYFGLGRCDRPARVTVRWPDRTHDSFGPLRTDRVARLTYPRC